MLGGATVCLFAMLLLGYTRPVASFFVRLGTTAVCPTRANITTPTCCLQIDVIGVERRTNNMARGAIYILYRLRHKRGSVLSSRHPTHITQLTDPL